MTSKDSEEKVEEKPEEKKVIEPPKKQTPILMKKGDYTVHVFIEEVKNLISVNPDFLPKPVVKVQCFNQSKRTSKVLEPCSEYTFNEHIFFEKTDLTTEILDSSKIIIEVYDYNNSRKREDFFGIYEFDLEYIYSSPNHCIKNLWIALANPESEDISKVRGYLKLSLSVLNENDERVELVPDPSKNNECVVPSQIKVSYKQLSIYIFKAEELPDMNNLFSKEKKANRKCDGYIECHYMGAVKRTKEVAMKNEIITWNTIFDIPVSQPTVSQKIVFYVKDSNTMMSDQLIGSFEINVNDVLANKYEKLQSINIYGSYVNSSSKIAKNMNTNAEIGSRWKGRVYLQIKYTDSECPMSGTRDINDNDLISQVINMPRNNLWSVYVKLFDAYYLPTKNDKYSIRIAIQDNSELFPFKEANNRNITWNLCKTLQCQTLTSLDNELPDLFIYLVNEKDQNICFQRIKASEFHMNQDTLMIKLLPEPCIGKVSKMYLSGIIKVKIMIFNRQVDKEPIDLSAFKDGNSQSQEDFDDLEAIYHKQSMEDKKESNVKPYTVVANIYMSRYLIPGDSNGVSDPYVVLSLYQDKKQTAVKNNCVNGIWNEKLRFDDVNMDLNDKSTWPVMLLTVMDKDIASDDMLGYSYVWLNSSSYAINSSQKIKPIWQQLYLEKSNRPQGQILISFHILDSEHSNLFDEIHIEPDTKPYSVEINVLGLRNLKPLSFLPVKKAYISFDLNSINVSGKKEDSLNPIKTQPGDGGANPNINSVIKFDVKLPKEETFIPEMQCEVYDHVLGGMFNQLLGIFMLSVKTLIRETHKTIERDIQQAKEIIEMNSRKEKQMFEKSEGAISTRRSEKDPLNTESNLIEEEKHILKNDGPSLNSPLLKDDKNHSYSISNISNFTEIRDTDFLVKSIEDLNILYTGTMNEKDMMINKDNSDFFVLKPSFMKFTVPGVKKGSKEYREYMVENTNEKPPSTYYFPIGFNRRNNNSREQTKEELNNKKHYRRIYGKELEKVEELGLGSPFLKCKLIREKYSDVEKDSGIFDAMKDINSKIVKRYTSNDDEFFEMISQNTLGTTDYETAEKETMKNLLMSFDVKDYGSFKGLIRIGEKEKMVEYEKFIQKIEKDNGGIVPKELHHLIKFREVSKNILIHRTVIIRVYVLEFNHLAKKDAFSESDPYIVIKVGNEIKVNEKQNKQDDSANCKWYKYYDILTELPGHSTMTIQVFDYDPIFSDELIGETSIDIEDRYFDQKWKDIANKPIETRQLKHPDHSNNQGQILMWMEIFDKNDRNAMQPWFISPEPEAELELRLIVWECEDIECMDIEDTSDVYVSAYLDQENIRSTDIHFRCQDGSPSFNYRLLIPIKLPRDKYELIFQVYDNDILARDDFICGGALNLYGLIKQVYNLDIPVVFKRDYQNSLGIEDKFQNVEFLPEKEDPEGTKFWVQLSKQGVSKKKGRVLCSLEILPKWKADLIPVGKGRDEPNVDPYLPPPVGRIQFTLNPFKMINQLVGPKFRRKCYMVICITLLVIYLICVIPYVIYHLGAEIINPFNYIGKKKNL